MVEVTFNSISIIFVLFFVLLSGKERKKMSLYLVGVIFFGMIFQGQKSFTGDSLILCSFFQFAKANTLFTELWNAVFTALSGFIAFLFSIDFLKRFERVNNAGRFLVVMIASMIGADIIYHIIPKVIQGQDFVLLLIKSALSMFFCIIVCIIGSKTYRQKREAKNESSKEDEEY